MISSTRFPRSFQARRAGGFRSASAASASSSPPATSPIARRCGRARSRSPGASRVEHTNSRFGSAAKKFRPRVTGIPSGAAAGAPAGEAASGGPPSAPGMPPHRVPHEEGAEPLEVLGRLGGPPHGLHEVRERVERGADEADHEVVVGGVETVAGEADVVSEAGVAVAPTEGAVLAEDARLLLAAEA